jgi:hypothetical protein
MLVLAEYIIKSRVKLIIIPFVNTVGIDLDITYIVFRSSFLTKTEFGVTSLILALASN